MGQLDAIRAWSSGWQFRGEKYLRRLDEERERERERETEKKSKRKKRFVREDSMRLQRSNYLRDLKRRLGTSMLFLCRPTVICNLRPPTHWPSHSRDTLYFRNRPSLRRWPSRYTVLLLSVHWKMITTRKKERRVGGKITMFRWRARLLFSVRNGDAFMRAGSLREEISRETRSNFNRWSQHSSQSVRGGASRAKKNKQKKNRETTSSDRSSFSTSTLSSAIITVLIIYIAKEERRLGEEDRILVEERFNRRALWGVWPKIKFRQRYIHCLNNTLWRTIMFYYTVIYFITM